MIYVGDVCHSEKSNQISLNLPPEGSLRGFIIELYSYITLYNAQEKLEEWKKVRGQETRQEDSIPI